MSYNPQRCPYCGFILGMRLLKFHSIPLYAEDDHRLDKLKHEAEYLINGPPVHEVSYPFCYKCKAGWLIQKPLLQGPLFGCYGKLLNVPEFSTVKVTMQFKFDLDFIPKKWLKKSKTSSEASEKIQKTS